MDYLVLAEFRLGDEGPWERYRAEVRTRSRVPPPLPELEDRVRSDVEHALGRDGVAVRNVHVRDL